MKLYPILFLFFSILFLWNCERSKFDVPLEEYQVYTWKQISTSPEVLGKKDTTVISDTLIKGVPINLDSLSLRAELYLEPNELNRIVESVDTVYTDSIGKYIAYSNQVSTLWFQDDPGFILSFYFHLIQGSPWSYQLVEIRNIDKEGTEVMNYEHLIDSIQSFRYQKSNELEN
ncbi:MAG: hypothetical protein JJ892_06395 [Balneola sp.]|jgi:hypothetical protein|nr:hypothetical protein [Balneola sp.]MBO6649953.1 hypothetical protein [Balneola sp.]MBO6711699.1 hypothetical protein [Balneola sp.]MBO6799893.1 hypothetical protein [Balneola sp.]MBO6871138.1 hypothetical protein [Balneola sp.]